jgi:hypothetical protein
LPAFVILSREQIHLFVSGRRTLVLVPRGDEAGHEPPYHAGARVPLVPAVGRSATCSVLVERVTDVALGEIGDDDARELGYRDVDEWMASWVAEHGLFNESARAWRIQVAVDHSEPARLLRAASGQHGRRALLPYTRIASEAIPGAGEAPDEHAHAAGRRHAHAAEHERFQERLAAAARLPLATRIELARADAQARGIRITQELRALERRVRVLEERVYRPADRYADAETA